MCEGGFPQITYSQTDLRAAVRIPAIQSSKTKCLEFRPPDAASNPYLAFAALLMAAIDGIQNKIHPGAALDPNPYGPTDDSSTTYSRVPASLEASLTALESDGEFLLRGTFFLQTCSKVGSRTNAAKTCNRYASNLIRTRFALTTMRRDL